MYYIDISQYVDLDIKMPLSILKRENNISNYQRDLKNIGQNMPLYSNIRGTT